MGFAAGGDGRLNSAGEKLLFVCGFRPGRALDCAPLGELHRLLEGDMANSVFISSCSRRQLARRRSARMGRRAARRRRIGTAPRRPVRGAARAGVGTARPVAIAVALMLALALVALVLFVGI